MIHSQSPRSVANATLVGAIVAFAIAFALHAASALAGAPVAVDTPAPIPTLRPFDAARDVKNIPFHARFGTKPGDKKQGYSLEGFAQTNDAVFAIIRHGDDDPHMYARNAALGNLTISSIDKSTGTVKLSNGSVLKRSEDIGSVLASPDASNPYDSLSSGVPR